MSRVAEGSSSQGDQAGRWNREVDEEDLKRVCVFVTAVLLSMQDLI